MGPFCAAVMKPAISALRGLPGLPLGGRCPGAIADRGAVRLISVLGFPFGAIPAAVKLAEAEAAADAGADELDVVPDFGALADRDSRLLLDDLAAISSLGLPVKVIVESGRLEAEALELWWKSASMPESVSSKAAAVSVPGHSRPGAAAAATGSGSGRHQGLRGHQQPGTGP